MPTIRQSMLDLLEKRDLSAREISQMLGVSEKDIPKHLEHIAKTARQQNRRIKVLPFACLDCGYVFRNRKKFTRPGRCPKCRGSYLEPPRFVLE